MLSFNFGSKINNVHLLIFIGTFTIASFYIYINISLFFQNPSPNTFYLYIEFNNALQEGQ